jgi:hypothetical protein
MIRPSACHGVAVKRRILTAARAFFVNPVCDTVVETRPGIRGVP